VGNAVATIVVAKWVKELDEDQLQTELASGGRGISDVREEDDVVASAETAVPTK